MRPRLLLSHTIAPIKSRSVCADFFSPRKNRSDFFSELLATKNRSCALTQSEKKSDLHSDFSRSSLRQKIAPCALGITLHVRMNIYIFSCTSFINYFNTQIIYFKSSSLFFPKFSTIINIIRPIIINPFKKGSQ